MKENRGRGIKENSRDYKNAVGVENNLMKIGKEGDNKIKIAVRSCRFHISWLRSEMDGYHSMLYNLTNQKRRLGIGEQINEQNRYSKIFFCSAVWLVLQRQICNYNKRAFWPMRFSMYLKTYFESMYICFQFLRNATKGQCEHRHTHACGICASFSWRNSIYRILSSAI